MEPENDGQGDHMTQKDGKSYYDVLGVSPDTNAAEIEEAYQRAKATYAGDSVALYSLYTQEERDAMLNEIGEAYETLSNESKKEAYDAVLTVAQQQEGFSQWDVESAYRDKTLIDSEKGIDAAAPSITLKAGLQSMDDMDSVATEQYRVLYTRLENISARHSSKVFAVTSAVKGEGKTVTSLNLAYVMAHYFKKKVVLIECDLRRPTLHTYFCDTIAERNIANAVRGGADVEAVLTQVEDTSLFLIPALQVAENSAELLGSQRMKALISNLKAEFDYVIVDSPPILHMADMNILAKIVDGLILVVRAGKTPKDIVVNAAKSLQNANITGIVLNDAEIAINRYYYM